MASPRASDIKLLVGATVGVLLTGFLIAGAALVATRGAKSVSCNQLNIGSAADIRKRLDTQGPQFISNGASCAFWLALDDGDITAYKVSQPSGCTLLLRDRATRWECGGETRDPSTLARYPVSIRRLGQIDSVFVDLRPPAPASTPAAG